MRLHYWQNETKGQTRIYVNGLPEGKRAWFAQDRCNQTRVETPEGPAPKDLCDAIAKSFQIATPFDRTEVVRIAQSDMRTSKSDSSKQGAAENNAAASPDRSIKTHPDGELIEFTPQPMPAPTTILIDPREPKEIRQRLKLVENLIVEEQTLDYGSYIIPGRLCIERLACDEIGALIRDDVKRLFHRVDAMLRQEGRPILILEGDVYAKSGVPIPQATGTLSYIVDKGIAPFPTINPAHTVYSIAKLVRHTIHGPGPDIRLRGAAPKHPQKAAVFLIEGLPGISAKLAHQMLGYFGSVMTLAMASEQQLREVPGVGAARAKIIYETLRAPF